MRTEGSSFEDQRVGGLGESMRPEKIRRMDACNVVASQIPFGTGVAIFLGIAPTKGQPAPT